MGHKLLRDRAELEARSDQAIVAAGKGAPICVDTVAIDKLPW